ncbi:TetR/AcrR family transcriptional regulator [Cryobacterium tepidiphilum]|uniref:TetR family transcriptional regulator n=1 Tax=Cryobacterium tepidiphilum TaxID=2486026 RepID=A0A3M8LSH6_9MICO|nr:TetR family transcriptional regulator C-terminal domain-containing protein [Cryobacterium tepidiphilum]RNE67448.1 TetR family transcriptional regulator [Cryobacterium tepidiphilum]
MSTSTRTRAERKAPEERAAEIQAAARRIALQQGLAAVTLRAVAGAVGVTPALVAHYAPNMDALVAETFGAIVRGELDEVREIVVQPTASRRLARLLSTLLDGSRADVTAVWVESWTLGRRNEALGASVRAEMDAWQQAVQEIIASGVEAGEFHTDDPTAVAWQLLGMIDGLNAHALVRWGAAAERGPLIAHAVEGMLGLPRGALAER